MAAVAYDAEVEFVDIAETHWKHSDDISTAVVVRTVTVARSDDGWSLFACDRPLDMLVVYVAACDKRCFARMGDCDGFCSRHLFDSKALPDGSHCLASAAIDIAATHEIDQNSIFNKSSSIQILRDFQRKIILF